ncbi:MAG: hypothetical protein IPL22_03985 [Bacteroidetes bacterium]|nr:hypothetical protein [Bacteroidota bacterium]
MIIAILLIALVAGLLFWGISIFNQLTSKNSPGAGRLEWHWSRITTAK